MKSFPLFLFHIMFALTFLVNVVFGISLQNGIISFSVIFLVYFFRFYISNQDISFRKLGILDLAVINFVFWNLFSIVDVIYFNRSILVYLKGVSYCLFPIYAFVSFSNSHYIDNLELVNKFLKYLLFSTLFAVSIGIYFYLLSPEYYVTYVLGNYEGLINDRDSIFMARLLSYFGDPTVIGNISVISIPILVYFVRQKRPPFTSILFNVFCFLLLTSGVLLSFARSAWVAWMVYIIYLLIIDNKYLGVRIFSVGFVILVSWGLFFVLNWNFDNPILIELQKRIFSFGGSFEERSTQIEYALGSISSSPLGIGLGQAGHKSLSEGVNIGVFDNNYLRIFTETGILGFLAFMMILFFSLYMCSRKSNFHKINNVRILVLIVLLIFYLQSIGSNILDLHYSSFLFWSFLGILSWTFKLDNNREY